MFNLFDPYANPAKASTDKFLSGLSSESLPTGGGNSPPTPSGVPLAPTTPVRRKNVPSSRNNDEVERFLNDSSIEESRKNELKRALDDGVSRDELNATIIARSKPKQETGDTGFISGIKESAVSRFEKGLEIADSDQSRASQVLQTGGQVAGFAGDVIGQSIASAYKAAGEPGKETAISALHSILSTEAGQEGLDALRMGMDKYGEWKSANPEKAANLEASLNIAQFVPVGKAAGFAGEKALRIAGKADRALSAPSVIKGTSFDAATGIEKQVEKTVPSFLQKTETSLAERSAKKAQEALTKTEGTAEWTKNSDELITKALKLPQGKADTANKIKVRNDRVREGVKSVADSEGVPSDAVDALKKASARKEKIWEKVKEANDSVTTPTPDVSIAKRIDDYMSTPEFALREKVLPGLRTKFDAYKEQFSKGTPLSQSDLQFLKTEQGKKIPPEGWAQMLETDKEKLFADGVVSKLISDQIDDNIESALGTTNKALNREYGAVRELEKHLARVSEGAARKGGSSLASHSDIFTVPEFILGAANVLGGNQTGWNSVLRAIGSKAISVGMNMKNDPNLLIRQLFNRHRSVKPTIGEKIGGGIMKAVGEENKSVKLVPKEPPKPAPTKPISRFEQKKPTISLKNEQAKANAKAYEEAVKRDAFNATKVIKKPTKKNVPKKRVKTDIKF